jgi:phosphonate transport system substrate-binding protein
MFFPTIEESVVRTGGEILVNALEDATGLKFQFTSGASTASIIDQLCASPENTLAFLPAHGYVQANEQCGAQPAFKAKHGGWGFTWTMFIVQRDSQIYSLSDLNNKKWFFSNRGSLFSQIYPGSHLNGRNIFAGPTQEVRSHREAVLAVYNGEAEFATAPYLPPNNPHRPWRVGDNPDIPESLVASCAPVLQPTSNDPTRTRLICGNWEVWDARADLRNEYPDIVQKVRILALTDPIPNDTVAFSPDFPAELRAYIKTALMSFSRTDGWTQSIGRSSFYGWEGLDPATDAEYEVVRQMVDHAGIPVDRLDLLR